MTIRIPLAKPEITDADREAVMQVLRTPHLSMGPRLHEFEQAMCHYTGSKYAIAVNSGTSALQIAVRALKLEPRSEVILPSFTFSAVLNVILQERLQPRFVDIDPETYNTTPEMVAAAITPRTRLVVAVHTFGVPADVNSYAQAIEQNSSRARRPFDSLLSVGRSGQGPRHSGRRPHAVAIIEDACEALGAQVRGQKAGTLGNAGLFAFYPNKQITTGEGGMLLTANAELAQTAQRLRNQGRNPALGWNQHAEIGFSYRISDMSCALGISQLARIETVVARRQALAESYDRGLAKIHEVIRPPVRNKVGRISWFVYPIRLADEFRAADRDWICEAMLKKGIAAGRYFAPLHRQPVFTSLSEMSECRLPNTEAVADRVIALPFFNELSHQEVQEVCGALEESIGELRRKT